MKYMYILLCIMSSFFAYKSLDAKENTIQYAFFMPQNSLQENTSIKDLSPKANNLTATPSPQKKVKKIIKRKIKKKKKTDLSQKQRSFPVVRTTLKHITETIPQKQTSTAQKEKTTPSKYTLEDMQPLQPLQQPQKIKKIAPQKSKELSLIEQLKQKDINDILYDIPHPNPKDPFYKQIYSLYTLELKTLNRRGSMPYNIRQEEALQKANSILRFEVTD